MIPTNLPPNPSLLNQECGISDQAVRAQVTKMLTFRPFIRSPRLSRLLRFCVEQKIQNRQDYLKEYTLGLEVFDRPESFDPRLDSIVRVVARRLRIIVEAYYAEEGRQDQIRIVFRAGNYAPTFQLRQDERPGLHQNTIIIIGGDASPDGMDDGLAATPERMMPTSGLRLEPLAHDAAVLLLHKLLEQDRTNMFVMAAAGTGDLLGAAASFSSKVHAASEL